MFISENAYVSLFKENQLFLEEFMESAMVKTNKRLISLNMYMKSNKVTEQDIQQLFLHIESKQDYLKRFYKTSLSIDPDISIRDAPMENTFSNNKLVKYKNIIRNMHLYDILKTTMSGLDNNPSYLTTLENLYNKNIIDYKLLTPSATHYIKKNRIGGVFSSFYFRASIMNPYLVYSLNESVLKGTKIFTPTLGWTSYCYGFLECPNVIEYVGTDVIESVCDKTQYFADMLYPNKSVDIFNCPSEKMLTNKNFASQYINHFDVVFFSPPYYKLEMYSGDEQSTELYKTYQDWLNNYWEPTVYLCYQVLQKGGRLCYILSGYGKNLEYNLVEDMNEITSKYFQEKMVLSMQNKNANMTSHRRTGEQIMIYEKV